MPQKKNSKKDLEKRVTKLKKKVATLTKGLSKKQSELSRSLSSVQKKLDGLRKQKAPGKRLLQTTEDLASRLHGLEENVAAVGRAGEELTARTHALEARAAETASQAGAFLRSDGEPDGSLLHGIELLRDRVGVAEDHLGRLSAAQEGLELQIALLSREAAGEVEPGPHADQGRWAERAEELATQLKDVQSHVVRETQDTADLAERSHELETSASELLRAEQALETRVSQLEQLSRELQQRGRSDDTSDTGSQVPELQVQISRAEEAADSLNRRTAALEAGHEALAKDDARLAGQIQAMEMRLSELADRDGEVASEPSTPLQTEQNLEQQTALLSADRSPHDTRIEEILRRAEALEKTGFNYTRHTDALSDRITMLNERLEGLMALDAERRLEDLERRGEALEKSLQAETADLGELRQTEDTLDQRLNMAIADAEALESRIDKLNKGSEQLNDELSRLDSAFEQAANEAQQQHHRVQAHETLLGQQKQQLDALVEAQDKADAGLGARVATLDESRQALQESSDRLQVQQARQEHETQSLQQKLRRRSILGLLMLLLAAGALVFLLQRGPAVPEALQSAMQAGSAADERAAAAIADIEKDMATMRRELTVLSDSLAQLARSVEEVEAQGAAEIPAQVMRLSDAVETLEQQGMQQQQDGAELRTGQEQLQTELERIAAEVESLGEKTDAAPLMSLASGGAEAGTTEMSAWVQARESGGYTLQLAGFYQPKSLLRFKTTYALGADTAVCRTEFQGREWHVVFHGIYETVGQALAAARQLSPELASHKPWVRRIPPTGEIRPL